MNTPRCLGLLLAAIALGVFTQISQTGNANPMIITFKALADHKTEMTVSESGFTRRTSSHFNSRSRTVSDKIAESLQS